ncbi:VanZ family protein [uncultured Vagococcus sp.]|uniref:VanZ family protein n=1 Tax=uncultured Vagococcus sp. TaxID=189676 RepID=UPI0028D07375|nr:VanZ family protein [uncultured Vagococcus sp.]
MMRKNKTSRVITLLFWLMFVVYLYFLGSMILFKGESPLEMLSDSRVGPRRVNLEPFYFMNDLTDINVVGNLLLFIPLGMYLRILLKRKWTGLFLMFVLSVGFEATQFIFNIGALDVDDVILNVTGGLFGMIVMGILSLFLKNKERLKTFMAIATTMIGVPVIIIYSLLKFANS